VALLVIAGEFDLSIGSMVGFAGIVIGLLVTQLGWPLWAAIGAAFVTAVLVGYLNGLVVVRTRLPSFIVTLATLFILRGLSIGITRAVTGRTQIPYILDNPPDPETAGIFAGHIFGGLVVLPNDEPRNAYFGGQQVLLDFACPLHFTPTSVFFVGKFQAHGVKRLGECLQFTPPWHFERCAKLTAGNRIHRCRHASQRPRDQPEQDGIHDCCRDHRQGRETCQPPEDFLPRAPPNVGGQFGNDHRGALVFVSSQHNKLALNYESRPTIAKCVQQCGVLVGGQLAVSVAK